MSMTIGGAFAKAFRRAGLCFERFNFAISRRRVRDQRFEQMMRGMRDFIDRAIERFLIHFRRLGESGKLPNKLQR